MYKRQIPGIVLIALWNGLGINVVIYLAGLSNISRELYEAARVDGANALQSFKSVTVPMLMPSITVCVTMTLIGGLKEFATTMAATGGGPGKASEMVSIHIYKNLYSYYQAGYGLSLIHISMSDPNKSYHFEIVCASEKMARQIRELICGFSMDAKIVQRKKSCLLYTSKCV